MPQGDKLKCLWKRKFLEEKGLFRKELKMM